MDKMDWLLSLHVGLNGSEQYKDIPFEEDLPVMKSFYTLGINEETNMPELKPVFDPKIQLKVEDVASTLRELAKTGNLFVSRNSKENENKFDLYQVASDYDTEVPQVIPYPKNTDEIENLPTVAKGIWNALCIFFDKILQLFSKSAEERIQQREDIEKTQEIEKSALESNLSWKDVIINNEKNVNDITFNRTEEYNIAVKTTAQEILDAKAKGTSEKEIDDGLRKKIHKLMVHREFRENFEDFLSGLEGDLKERVKKEYLKVEDKERDEAFTTEKTQSESEWLIRTGELDELRNLKRTYRGEISNDIKSIQTFQMSDYFGDDANSITNETPKYRTIFSFGNMAAFIKNFEWGDIDGVTLDMEKYMRFKEVAGKENSKYVEAFKEWEKNKDIEAFSEFVSEQINQVSDALVKCKPGSQQEKTICFLLNEFYNTAEELGKDVNLIEKIDDKCRKKMPNTFDQIKGRMVLNDALDKGRLAEMKLLSFDDRNFSRQINKDELKSALLGASVKKQLEIAKTSKKLDDLYKAYGKNPKKLNSINEDLSKTGAFKRMTKLNALTMSKSISKDRDVFVKLYQACLKESKMVKRFDAVVKNKDNEKQQDANQIQPKQPVAGKK